MSLTSLLSNDTELRQRLLYSFPKHELEYDYNKILHAPALSPNYSLVGTAFDYLLRFYLQKENKKKVITDRKWIADEAFEKINESNRLRRSNPDIINHYKRAKDNYRKFLSEGRLTNQLIKSTIFLARLDTYYRAGYDENFTSCDDRDVEDLKALISLVDFDLFKAEKKIFLNPHFGDASNLVGGADADLIIDDLLIDIKVVKNLKFEREYFNQLLGYYLLSRIGGVNGNRRINPIKKIGVYFARHGKLKIFTLEKIASDKQFEEFQKWFVDYVERKTQSDFNHRDVGISHPELDRLFEEQPIKKMDGVVIANGNNGRRIAEVDISYLTKSKEVMDEAIAFLIAEWKEQKKRRNAIEVELGKM